MDVTAIGELLEELRALERVRSVLLAAPRAPEWRYVIQVIDMQIRLDLALLAAADPAVVAAVRTDTAPASEPPSTVH